MAGLQEARVSPPPEVKPPVVEALLWHQSSPAYAQAFAELTSGDQRKSCLRLSGVNENNCLESGQLSTSQFLAITIH